MGTEIDPPAHRAACLAPALRAGMARSEQVRGVSQTSSYTIGAQCECTENNRAKRDGFAVYSCSISCGNALADSPAIMAPYRQPDWGGFDAHDSWGSDAGRLFATGSAADRTDIADEPPGKCIPE